MAGTRIITEEEALRLEDLYIGDEEVKEIKKYIQENLTSKADWRQNFRHLDIYNRINFHRGILKKLETIRRTPSSSTVEEVITLLYTMGYGLKRIVFLLWEWGFPLQNRFIVTQFVKRNKTKLKVERQKFMALIDETKSKVFQDCAEEVKGEEGRTVKIYLEKLAELNTELDNLDCVEEHTKARRLRKDIMEMTEFLNKVHGVSDVREAVIKVAAQKSILREQKRLQSGKGDVPILENGQTSSEEDVGAQFLTEVTVGNQ